MGKNRKDEADTKESGMKKGAYVAANNASAPRQPRTDMNEVKP